MKDSQPLNKIDAFICDKVFKFMDDHEDEIVDVIVKGVEVLNLGCELLEQFNKPKGNKNDSRRIDGEIKEREPES